MVLWLLSPGTVRWVISDDGFLIGQVTLSGTYSLLAVGALFGVIGVSAHRWVDHWLIGPGWFPQVTTALGPGAMVGSMLVHTDGVDFSSSGRSGSRSRSSCSSRRCDTGA